MYPKALATAALAALAVAAEWLVGQRHEWFISDWPVTKEPKLVEHLASMLGAASLAAEA